VFNVINQKKRSWSVETDNGVGLARPRSGLRGKTKNLILRPKPKPRPRPNIPAAGEWRWLTSSIHVTTLHSAVKSCSETLPNTERKTTFEQQNSNRFNSRFGFIAGFWRLAARPSVIVSFSSVLPVALVTSLPALLKPEVALSPLLLSTSPLDVDVQLSVRTGWFTSTCSTVPEAPAPS